MTNWTRFSNPSQLYRSARLLFDVEDGLTLSEYNKFARELRPENITSRLPKLDTSDLYSSNIESSRPLRFDTMVQKVHAAWHRAFLDDRGFVATRWELPMVVDPSVGTWAQRTANPHAHPAAASGARRRR